MANYKLTFSPKEKTLKIAEYFQPQGQPFGMIRTEISEMNIERAMLQSLAELAGNTHKNKKDVFLAADLSGRIENLTDNDEYIIIDEIDKNNLEKGIEESMGKRPTPWFKCHSMWAQLVETKPIEVKEKKEVEKQNDQN